MATLITTGNSSGITGRCDAKCHYAVHPECDCVCGGRNHGVGLEQARENTREMAEELMEAGHLVSKEIAQASFFDCLAQEVS